MGLSNKSRLIAMLSLTSFFFLVEIIVGYVTGSMALVADSFHMLSDVAALVVAFFSVQMSPKKWPKNTFGWARAEVLGAMVNSAFLVALCFTIFVESIKRFIHHEEIQNPVWIMVVGALGLLVNVIGLALFSNSSGGGHGHHGHSHHHHRPVNNKSKSKQTESIKSLKVDGTAAENFNDIDNNIKSDGKGDVSSATSTYSVESSPSPDSASQMNMRGVFLHLMGDALGSVVVIVSAAVLIWKRDWEYKMYLDPALSLVMVFILISSALPLLKSSIMILLQTVPAHIQIDELKRKLISEVDGVIDVHDFHIWQLAGDRIVATAHIRCRNVTEYIRIIPKVKEFFHREGIHSTTIQPEYTDPLEEQETNELHETSECVLINRGNKEAVV